MNRFFKKIITVLTNEQGAEFVEYPSFAVAIIVTGMPAVILLRTAVNTKLSELTTYITGL